jgi:Phage-related minor tail protein
MGKFVLTARLQLKEPAELGAVVQKIQNSLSGVKIDVRTSGVTKATRDVQALKQATDATNTSAEALAKTFAISFKRFVTFSLATRAVGLLTTSLGGAFGEAVAFEKELVRVSQVTNKSVQELRGLSDEVTRLATGFGVSSKTLLNVSLTLAQAGFSANDAKVALEALAKTELTPTFTDINKTTEGAIALFNQFGKGAEALEQQLGAINKVSADFAVESDDLIDAVRRVGGVFKSSGGTLEELIALFTSVRATTRESAESISTGLRTIFVRIQRPKTIEYLKNLGVNLIDLEGKFVGPLKAVELLNKRFADLKTGDPQFIQVAEELAGFRQIGKVIPLLQQYAVTQEALESAKKGQGSLDRDAAKAQETLANRIVKVKEEFLALIRDVYESPVFQTLAKSSLIFAESLIKVADSVKNLIPLLGVFAAIKLSSSIGTFLGGFGRNLKSAQGFATGGKVTGPSGTDKVDARLTAGEYVVTEDIVRKEGVTAFNKLNSGKATIVDKTAGKGNVQHFAEGGLVYKTKPGAFAGFFMSPSKETAGYENEDYGIQRPITESVGKPGTDSYRSVTIDQGSTVRRFLLSRKRLEDNKSLVDNIDGRVKKGVYDTVLASADEINKTISIDPQIKIDTKQLTKAASDLANDSQVYTTLSGYIFEGVIQGLTNAKFSGGTANLDFPDLTGDKVKEKLSTMFGIRSGGLDPTIAADAKRTINPENSVAVLQKVAKEYLKNPNLVSPGLELQDEAQQAVNRSYKVDNSPQRVGNSVVVAPVLLYEEAKKISGLQDLSKSTFNKISEKGLDSITESDTDPLYASLIRTNGYGKNATLKTKQDREKAKKIFDALKTNREKLGFANGGFVSGPSGVDKVDARLTDGEYVIKRDIVRKEGVAALNRLNSGESSIQHFANGGLVRKVGTIDADVLEQHKDITGPEIERLGIKGGTTGYRNYLMLEALRRRQEGSLKKIKSITGSAGSGKSTLAEGGRDTSAADAASLRKTLRIQILKVADLDNVDEVVEVGTALSPDRIQYIRGTDFSLGLSSTTREEMDAVKARRAARTSEGTGYGRAPGSAKYAPVHTGSLEAQLIAENLPVKFKSVLGGTKGPSQLPSVVKKPIGLFYGSFSPTTVGHAAVQDVAKAMGIAAEDFVVLVGNDVGGKRNDEHSHRNIVFNQKFRTEMAKRSFPGANVVAARADETNFGGSLPKAFDVSGNRTSYVVPAAGSTAFFTDDKGPNSTNKYTNAGYNLKPLARIGDISGTKTREALFSNNADDLDGLLTTGGKALIAHNSDIIQNRKNALSRIFDLSEKKTAKRLSVYESELAKYPARFDVSFLKTIKSSLLSADPGIDPLDLETTAKSMFEKMKAEKDPLAKKVASIKRAETDLPLKIMAKLEGLYPQRYAFRYDVPTTKDTALVNKPIALAREIQKAAETQIEPKASVPIPPLPVGLRVKQAPVKVPLVTRQLSGDQFLAEANNIRETVKTKGKSVMLKDLAKEYARTVQTPDDQSFQTYLKIIEGDSKVIDILKKRHFEEFKKGALKLNRGSPGMVRGPGGIDQIPAMLSSGEMVMSRAAVQMAGEEELADLNRRAGGGRAGGVNKGGVLHFSGGSTKSISGGKSTTFNEQNLFAGFAFISVLGSALSTVADQATTFGKILSTVNQAVIAIGSSFLLTKQFIDKGKSSVEKFNKRLEDKGQERDILKNKLPQKEEYLKKASTNRDRFAKRAEHSEKDFQVTNLVLGKDVKESESIIKKSENRLAEIEAKSLASKATGIQLTPTEKKERKVLEGSVAFHTERKDQYLTQIESKRQVAEKDKQDFNVIDTDVKKRENRLQKQKNRQSSLKPKFFERVTEGIEKYTGKGSIEKAGSAVANFTAGVVIAAQAVSTLASAAKEYYQNQADKALSKGDYSNFKENSLTALSAGKIESAANATSTGATIGLAIGAALAPFTGGLSLVIAPLIGALGGLTSALLFSTKDYKALQEIESKIIESAQKRSAQAIDDFSNKILDIGELSTLYDKEGGAAQAAIFNKSLLQIEENIKKTSGKTVSIVPTRDQAAKAAGVELYDIYSGGEGGDIIVDRKLTKEEEQKVSDSAAKITKEKFVENYNKADKETQTGIERETKSIFNTGNDNISKVTNSNLSDLDKVKLIETFVKSQENFAKALDGTDLEPIGKNSLQVSYHLLNLAKTAEVLNKLESERLRLSSGFNTALSKVTQTIADLEGGTFSSQRASDDIESSFNTIGNSQKAADSIDTYVKQISPRIKDDRAKVELDREAAGLKNFLAGFDSLKSGLITVSNKKDLPSIKQDALLDIKKAFGGGAAGDLAADTFGKNFDPKGDDLASIQSEFKSAIDKTISELGPEAKKLFSGLFAGLSSTADIQKAILEKLKGINAAYQTQLSAVKSSYDIEKESRKGIAEAGGKAFKPADSYNLDVQRFNEVLGGVDKTFDEKTGEKSKVTTASKKDDPKKLAEVAALQAKRDAAFESQKKRQDRANTFAEAARKEQVAIDEAKKADPNASVADKEALVKLNNKLAQDNQNIANQKATEARDLKTTIDSTDTKKRKALFVGPTDGSTASLVRTGKSIRERIQQTTAELKTGTVDPVQYAKLQDTLTRLQSAMTDNIEVIRSKIQSDKDSLEILQKKNQLEKDSLQDLLSGDIASFFKKQASVGAQAAIATGDDRLVKSFGASAIGGAIDNLKQLQGAGVTELYGRQIGGAGGLIEGGAKAGLDLRGAPNSLASAQLLAGTTAKENVLNASLREGNAALGAVGGINGETRKAADSIFDLSVNTFARAVQSFEILAPKLAKPTEQTIPPNVPSPQGQASAVSAGAAVSQTALTTPLVPGATPTTTSIAATSPSHRFFSQEDQNGFNTFLNATIKLSEAVAKLSQTTITVALAPSVVTVNLTSTELLSTLGPQMEQLVYNKTSERLKEFAANLERGKSPTASIG